MSDEMHTSGNPLTDTADSISAAASHATAAVAAELNEVEEAATGALSNFHEGLKKKNHSTYAVVGWMVIGGIIGFLIGQK